MGNQEIEGLGEEGVGGFRVFGAFDFTADIEASSNDRLGFWMSPSKIAKFRSSRKS